MKNNTRLPILLTALDFVTTAFALICDLQQYTVLWGYLAPLSRFLGPNLA
jgi:hypothetical protein